MKYLILLLFTLTILICPAQTQAQQADISPDERAEATEAFIRGITHFENGEYDEAIVLLSFAQMKLAEEPGVNYALADLYLAKGDLTNAAYYARTAADKAPENKWYHLKLAEIHKEAGREEATIEAYNRALQHHPNDLNILNQLADTYVQFGELLKSNEIYDKIIKRIGSDFEIHLRKFRNFNALNMRDSSLAELQQLRKLEPGNLTTLRTISQFYLELGEEELALEILLEARERNARDPQTLLLLAEIYAYNSEWDELSNVFVTMLEDPLIYPSQKQELVRFMYVQSQQNPEDAELAEKMAEVLLSFSENEPEYGPAQLLAAEFFLQQNENEKALEKLKLTNQLMPHQAEPWRQRVQILFSMERYDEVIELSDAAVENAPDDAFIQFFTGASYMLNGENDQALTWLEEASLSPANRNFRSVIHGTKGDVLQDLDKWEDAKSSYETALRLDPNNHTAMNNYAYFMSIRSENLEYALDLSETAVSYEPSNAAYLDTLGWIYFKKGDYEQALRYIQKSVDTGDASAEVFEHLGDVYEALKDFENAVKWWNKALEEDSEREYLNDRIESVLP